MSNSNWSFLGGEGETASAPAPPVPPAPLPAARTGLQLRKVFETGGQSTMVLVAALVVALILYWFFVIAKRPNSSVKKLAQKVATPVVHVTAPPSVPVYEQNRDFSDTTLERHMWD